MTTPEQNQTLVPAGPGANLPALGSPAASTDFLSRVKETIEILTGMRGGASSNWDRAVTFRDLYGAGFAMSGPGMPGGPAGAAGAPPYLVGTASGVYQQLFNQLRQDLENSSAFRTLRTRIGSAEDLASLPDEFSSQLQQSLDQVARERQADIRTVERKVQTNAISVASRLDEITAALDKVAAGVRQFNGAYADDVRAVATAIRQVSAGIGDLGGVTIEEKFLAQADINTGLLGQWSVKIQTGTDDHPIIAGIALSSEGPTADNTTSSLVFMADRFGFYTANGTMLPFGIDDKNNVFVNGKLLVNAGGKTLEGYLSGAINYIGAFAAAPAVAGRNINDVYKNTTDGNTYILQASGASAAWQLWLAAGQPGRGDKGDPGQRGSIILSAATGGASWSDAEATAAIQGVSYGPLLLDQVTLYNQGAGFTDTRTWSGSAWVEAAIVINGNQIVHGSILTEALAAKTVTASKLVVGSPDNLLPDPQFRDLNWWGYAGSGVSVSQWADRGQQTPWIGGTSVYLYPSDNVYRSEDSQFFQLEQGATYRLTIQVNLTADYAGSLSIFFLVDGWAWLHMTGTDTGYTWPDGLGVSLNNNAPKGIQTYVTQVTLPKGIPATGRGLIRTRWQTSSGVVEIGGLSIVRMSDDSLVPDASIGSAKIRDLRTANYGEDGAGNPTSGAKLASSGVAFKVASNGLQIGAQIFSDYWFRLVQGIDGSYANGRVIWRGNNDATTRGGAPDINCLGIKFVSSQVLNSNFQQVYFGYTLTPNNYSSYVDNLDAMQQIHIQFFQSAGAGAPFTEFYWTCPSRTYDGAAGIVQGSLSWGWRFNGPGSLGTIGGQLESSGLFTGYTRARIANSYGFSASRDFGPATGVNQDLPGANIYGSGGSAGGGSGGGSGGGGGACPAPWVKVRLANGQEVNAIDLYNGARVAAVDDNTMETLPAGGVIRDISTMWAQRYQVRLADGTRTEWSENHRFAVTGRGWVHVQDLQPGDHIMGLKECIVDSVLATTTAEVVSFRVEGAGTYFAGGMLCHNYKMQQF
jgi:hypothetical protein